MIDVPKLKRGLVGQFDMLVHLLESLGITHIKCNKGTQEIRFATTQDSNPTSNLLNVNTLSYVNFALGLNGDIITLVSYFNKSPFKDTLRYIIEVCGISEDDYNKGEGRYKHAFKSVYTLLKEEKISNRHNDTYLDFTQPLYPTECLLEYDNGCNKMFFDDGIGYRTQEYFKVGYDKITNRITIPEWDNSGNLVGIMGRLNDYHCDKGTRWLPIIPCQRNKLLYGYHFNYLHIVNSPILLIGESEKFVMQLYTKGIRSALALSGNKISKYQQALIKALAIKKIIVCLDEGQDKEYIRNEAKTIMSNNHIYKNKVGYIYDTNNEILLSGSKASPSDVDSDKLRYLLKHKVEWLG